MMQIAQMITDMDASEGLYEVVDMLVLRAFVTWSDLILDVGQSSVVLRFYFVS